MAIYRVPRSNALRAGLATALPRASPAPTSGIAMVATAIAGSMYFAPILAPEWIALFPSFDALWRDFEPTLLSIYTIPRN